MTTKPKILLHFKQNNVAEHKAAFSEYMLTFSQLKFLIFYYGKALHIKKQGILWLSAEIYVSVFSSTEHFYL